MIIPQENEKDLAEIPKNVTGSLKIKPVRWIDEVLDIALERALVPLTVKVESATDAPPEPVPEREAETLLPRAH